LVIRAYTHFKELYLTVFLLSGILIAGTTGYMLIEGFTLIEAIYMTIITVSTVGFGEIHTLTDSGRVFTAIMILFSFGIFAFAASSLTRYIVTGQLRDYFKNYKVDTLLDNIKGHTIVCGYGRNGSQAIETLQAYEKKVVIIENDEYILNRLKEKKLAYLNGDATDENTLKKAGIMRAEALITTLPKDADNMFVVLTSRELNPRLHIISRASKDTSEKKLRIAGADNVILPDKVGGAHMASLVVTPDVYEFLDHISVMGSNEVNLEEINFDHLPEKYHNKTLAELDRDYNTGCLIIGFRTTDGQYVINPPGELEIIPGSKIFVLGRPDQISALNDIFNLRSTEA
jgi:voltage-gated potassium channel